MAFRIRNASGMGVGGYARLLRRLLLRFIGSCFGIGEEGGDVWKEQ